MKINIQSPRLELPLEIEKAVIKKFERFAKFDSSIMSCDVVLKKEKSAKQDGFIVEAKLAITGNDMFAKESSTSFEIAAEKVCIDLENNFRKQKEKKNIKNTKAVDQLVTDEGEDDETLE